MQDRNVFTRHRTPSGGALEVLLFRNANLLDLLTSPVGNRSLVTTVVRSFVKRSCEPLVIGHSQSGRPPAQHWEPLWPPSPALKTRVKTPDH